MKVSILFEDGRSAVTTISDAEMRLLEAEAEAERGCRMSRRRNWTNRAGSVLGVNPYTGKLVRGKKLSPPLTKGQRKENSDEICSGDKDL